MRAWALPFVMLFFPSSAMAAGRGVEPWYALDTQITWVRGGHTLDSEPVETDTRTVPASSVRSPAALTLLGVQGAWGVTADDRLVLPILGFGVAAAAGRYPTVHTSLDGSIARISPATSSYVTLWLGGLGLRGKERRLQWQVLVRPGWSFLSMGGKVAAAGDSVDVNVRTSMFTLRSEFELCRRLDPTSRVCLFGGPTLYEQGVFTGGQAGLRWEMGP